MTEDMHEDYARGRQLGSHSHHVHCQIDIAPLDLLVSY